MKKILSPAEKHFLELRESTHDGKPYTNEEIAQIMNVSCERIRQIEYNLARPQIRATRNRSLKEFLSE